MVEEIAPKVVETPPNLNDHCSVKWQIRGTATTTTTTETPITLEAVVVERRPISRENPCKRLPVGAVEGLKADEIEYYVHFVGHDRRLDCWVSLDQFDLETLESGSPECYEERLVRQRDSSQNLTIDHSLTDDSMTAMEAAAPVYMGGGNFHGDSAGEKEHEEATKLKNVEKIVMGKWEVEAWYFSPFPDEYSNIGTLYVCEFCLSYMRKTRTFLSHKETCKCRRPPGKEIYREDDIAVYELDGKDHRVYCQKLCLIAKLFLDHKTLYYDTTPFYFYIITRVDDQGSHIVGYFSKEKLSTENYNLACILTLPQYQRDGYGKFIISLSYELTKREGKTGSPEKPLSDLGKLSYRSYWTYVLMHLLDSYDMTQNVTIADMSEKTGIKVEDIISTLQYLDMIKVWKGLHVVHVKQEVIQQYIKQE
jgi:histone acetyltransferase MYST1